MTVCRDHPITRSSSARFNMPGSRRDDRRKLKSVPNADMWGPAGAKQNDAALVGKNMATYASIR